MIICLGNDNEVLWLHDDDTVKEQEQYIDDDSVIVVDAELSFPYPPDDGYRYVPRYDEGKKEIYLEKMEKIKLPQYDLTEKTSEMVEITSFDNLINMDMLLAMDEKLNAIMEHLGL